jgi:phosphonate C-P lyase system protein PhnG
MDSQTEYHQLTAIINDMPREAVRELLELAENAPIQIISTPIAGLTMMHVLDAFDSEFLLGEVLVSKAEVLLHGERGFSMVTSDEPERALARASADVLLKVGDDLLRTRVYKLLLREQAELDRRRSDEQRLIAGTKVNFDLMPGS